METVKNLFFQDHHILQIWKLLKISYFKTTTPTKSRTVKNLFFQDHHILQIVETVKNLFFQDHHTNQK